MYIPNIKTDSLGILISEKTIPTIVAAWKIDEDSLIAASYLPTQMYFIASRPSRIMAPSAFDKEFIMISDNEYVSDERSTFVARKK